MEPMVETRHLLWMTGLLEAKSRGIVPETKAKMATKIENTILTEMDILKVLDQIVMKKVYLKNIYDVNDPSIKFGHIKVANIFLFHFST